MLVRVILYTLLCSRVFGFITPSFSRPVIKPIKHANVLKTKTSLNSSSGGVSDENNEVKRIFQNVAKSVVKNDAKSTNIELASRGQNFSSYRRRFDYLSLSTTNSPSTWKRDHSQNSHVEELLIAAGLSEDEAREANQAETLQVYKRMDSAEQTRIKSIGSENDVKFDVDTVVGMDLLENIVKGVASARDGSFIKVKSRWNGDTYVSEAYLNEGERPFLRVDKMLEFSNNDGDHTGDNLGMTVKSTLLLEGMEPMTCTEVYIRTYNVDHNEVLSTTAQRVPGCIANVGVRTVLVPKKGESSGNHRMAYEVLIDGEADAVLSRGLLAVLQTTLSSIDAQGVLGIDPTTVADELQLRTVLTSGRNDGLASIVAIVQQQIKDVLFDAGDDIDTSAKVNETLYDEAVKKPTVAMLLSGGVDSSVALNLLVREGYDVTAFYLKIWLEDELAHLGQCPWEDDYQVCTEVCEQAGVPLESISLQREYRDTVISYTIDEARKGRTPNPDIMCNSRVKFGCFYDAISTRDFDYVATGHYAQLQEKETSAGTEKILLRAPDPVKDQSYFLAALTQQQLNRVLFPIGHFEKSKVRELAKEFDL